MDKYAVCVGTSNVDIQGFAGKPVISNDKNPGGKIEVWAGGVTRNIGENLARLDVPVKMLTAIGDDIHAAKILDDSIGAGMDMTQVLKLKNCRSGSYISITDTDGDLFVGLTDMSIAGEMTVDYFESKQAILDGASIMVLSPCLSADAIDFLGHHFDDKPIFLDVVSKGYVPGLRQHLGLFHTVKANLPEAEELTGITIAGDEDLARAANTVLEQGVQCMVISLGAEGVFYQDRDGRTLRKRTKEVTHMVNATGAGDALAAGLVYGYVHQLDLDTTLDFAMTAAILTLNHKNTINPWLSREMVIQNMQEWKL